MELKEENNYLQLILVNFICSKQICEQSAFGFISSHKMAFTILYLIYQIYIYNIYTLYIYKLIRIKLIITKSYSPSLKNHRELEIHTDEDW